MIQQVFVDLLVIMYAALYASGSKSEGSSVAAYYAVGFIAFWTMHVQVVFFAILGNADPMYNQSQFDQLLSKADGSTDDIPASPVRATTVGSPSNKVDNAA